VAVAGQNNPPGIPRRTRRVEREGRGSNPQNTNLKGSDAQKRQQQKKR
jgi:hypothetical protein